MPVFQTLVHPTDFDEPSKEAFRVARSLAQALGARVVVFHVVGHPAIVTQDGRVLRNPHDSEPIDLWAEYRTLQADTPKVPVQYAVVVGDRSQSRRLLEEKGPRAGRRGPRRDGQPRPSRHPPAPLGEQGRGGRAGVPLPRAGREGALPEGARPGFGGRGSHERVSRL
jgi:hypothetical protein